LVTLGYQAIEISRTLDREHRFQDLFLWHGLCAEMTEVFADECQRILGSLIRKKHGIRFSFGYPGTPDLGQHGRFVALVGGHEIDVHVTESGMLDPEFSTSAMVLWTSDGGRA
jgi:cobalamin-dependent methionine synthase I